MSQAPIRIGPYRVVSRLGAGGMAETFVAERRGPGTFRQRVCLKRVHREHESDPEFVRQFLSEATLAATLRHANIVQVLDFGNDETGGYYMALELVEGLDLSMLTEGQPLPARLVTHLAVELTTALAFAHRSGEARGGIVHRDISPSNVLVSTEGEVKLADFGIARSLQGPSYTKTGIIKGKTPYMAPEYARTARFDARCDLFALGVTLYECLAGVRPYDGQTDLETFEQAASGEHVPLIERAPTAPSPLVVLIEQLIQPDPDARPQTAESLLDALLALPAHTGARRELAALVNERRAAMSTPPADPLADTAVSIPPPQPTRTRPSERPAPDEPAASPTRAPRSSLVLLAAAVTLLAAVVVVASTQREHGKAAEPSAPPAAQAPPASPAVTAPAPKPPAPVPTQAPEVDGKRDAGLRRQRAARARLSVAVVPFGEVLVDGRRVGTAPVQLKLTPGMHEVEGRTQGTSIKQSVTLRAGEHRDLVLR